MRQGRKRLMVGKTMGCQDVCMAGNLAPDIQLARRERRLHEGNGERFQHLRSDEDVFRRYQHVVPARAQAAHQQATHLLKNLRRRLDGKPLEPFEYRDFGSLVSMGEYSTVGSLMGKLLGGSIFVEGLFARLMYISLYRMHLYALHGAARVVFDLLGLMFTRRTEPRVKLH